MLPLMMTAVVALGIFLALVVMALGAESGGRFHRALAVPAMWILGVAMWAGAAACALGAGWLLVSGVRWLLT